MTTSASPLERPALPAGVAADLTEYLVDAAQRTVLFWDTIRQRGDNYLEFLKQGEPPVLTFDYEMIVDGRKLPCPSNYSLLRIKPGPGQTTDPAKRPYMVVDPRAGQVAGIGGMKPESEIGYALAAGHPVYHVSFFPKPVPGQTLADVAAAEIAFLEEVVRRHPRADKPCVIGNCQAGWAVAALAAVRPDLIGALVLAGAPLSYWAGASGKNPMRYTGGMLGGKWLELLACDLGHGLFDGAYLVQNFENLNPANTLWDKYYNLYSKIDTEPQRFLEFETWWGAYSLMNADEIDAIVSELFIGNKLEAAQVRNPSGTAIDLRNIRCPIVILCSFGDNITPPQQALDWIEDVYGDEKQIMAAGQTIVYVLHQDIGHLGIFVSGRVAKKEHKELIATLEMIDALGPGLYQMIIEPKQPGAKYAELEPGEYLVRIERRKMDDIRSFEDTREEEKYFQTVDAVSKVNERLYKLFLRPWVRAMSSERSAERIRRLNPLRLQHWMFSGLNPSMASLPRLAARARENRRPVREDNPFLLWERTGSNMIHAALDTFREIRDDCVEMLFNSLYGPNRLGAIFPPEPRALPKEERLAVAPAPPDLSQARFCAGGPLAAVLRMIAVGMMQAGVADRRSLRIFGSLLGLSRFKDVTPAQLKSMVKEQVQLLRLDRERALQALAVMLPTKEMREAAVAVVSEVLMVAPEELTMDRPLVRKISEILKLGPEISLAPAKAIVGAAGSAAVTDNGRHRRPARAAKAQTADRGAAAHLTKRAGPNGSHARPRHAAHARHRPNRTAHR